MHKVAQVLQLLCRERLSGAAKHDDRRLVQDCRSDGGRPACCIQAANIAPSRAQVTCQLLVAAAQVELLALA